MDIDVGEGVTTSEYERTRQARIEENKKRLQELGLFNKSHTIFSENGAKRSKVRANKPKIGNSNSNSIAGTPQLSRRSSRLQNATPVNYAEVPPLWLEVQSKPKAKRASQLQCTEEIYTEEHENLLGSTLSEWTMFQDGYDVDGRRIYDNINGKTCHQCRQKTLGLRTHCSNCGDDLVQGQLCGDCLYMRYGENILEARENPNWLCPVCRGICNCSLCRVKRGWAPTGAIYRQIKNQGYKSVAHYLILTRRSAKVSEIDTTSEKVNSTEQETISVEAKDMKPMDPLSSAKRSLCFPTNAEKITETSDFDEKPGNCNSGAAASTGLNMQETATCEENRGTKLDRTGSHDIAQTASQDGNKKKRKATTAKVAAEPSGIALRLRSRTRNSK